MNDNDKNEEVRIICPACRCTAVQKGAVVSIDEEASVIEAYPLDKEDWALLKWIDARRRNPPIAERLIGRAK